MSILDKLIAAVTPPESEQDRIDAHARAREHASRAPWLAMVLDHHQQIDAAFAAVKSASTAADRRNNLRHLGELLAGHSLAEEGVIYPALSDAGDTGHATMAYTEQAAAKMQLGLLERMDPMSKDFEDKLGHLEGAVKHHVYQEESTWFIDLVNASPNADHVMISERYSEEFNRYMNGGTSNSTAPSNDMADSQPLMFQQKTGSMDDDQTYGPLSDARPEMGDTQAPRPSLLQEDVGNRENVGIVTPDAYPQADRDIGNPANNRGQSPSTGSGEVSGSGAGAGGGGNSEDYDADPKGGSGKVEQQAMRPAPLDDEDAPIGGMR
ncbi:MAG: hemerythrin domain-containing protein [Sphingorhabdus sp.]